MIRFINFILRFVLGAVFIFAGALKIYDPATFATDIANYRLLPHAWVNLLAITLPWIEVLAGLLLVVGIWVRPSALLVTAMLVVFLVAVSQALVRGLDIRCGCFGTFGGRRAGLQTLLTDLVLLAMAVWLTWKRKEDT